MDTKLPLHDALNAVYQPLHQAASRLHVLLREFDASARLCYYNLHEVKTGGEYRTEYFPLPEIELRGRLYADVGFSLDGSVWLEVALPCERALRLDYEALKSQYPGLEVYSCEDYLGDFLREKADNAAVYRAIKAAGAQEIMHFFPIGQPDMQAIPPILNLFIERACQTKGENLCIPQNS